MDLIKKYLPKTYYAGLSSEERLKMMVESWQRAIKVNQELEEKLSSLLEPPVSEKFAGMVDKDTFKEVAEFVELEINEKHSNYWSNIAMGNASARFWHAYKKYASKFSR